MYAIYAKSIYFPDTHPLMICLFDRAEDAEKYIEESKLSPDMATGEHKFRYISLLSHSIDPYVQSVRLILNPYIPTLNEYKGFKRQIYSGYCMCGHHTEDHHGGMIVNPDAGKVMGDRLAGECEFFGFNEDGGLDEEGNNHCGRYIDIEDPDEELKSTWEGTKR